MEPASKNDSALKQSGMASSSLRRVSFASRASFSTFVEPVNTPIPPRPPLLKRTELGKLTSQAQKDRFLLQSMGDFALFKKCVMYGANPSYQDFSGNSPLHYAAREGNLQLLQYLISRYDVDIYSKNAKGQTALAIAIQQKNMIFASTLMEKMKLSESELNQYRALDQSNRELYDLIQKKRTHHLVSEQLPQDQYLLSPEKPVDMNQIKLILFPSTARNQCLLFKIAASSVSMITSTELYLEQPYLRFRVESEKMKKWDHLNVVKFMARCVFKEHIGMTFAIPSGWLSYSYAWGSTSSIRTSIALQVLDGFSYLSKHGVLLLNFKLTDVIEYKNDLFNNYKIGNFRPNAVNSSVFTSNLQACTAAIWELAILEIFSAGMNMHWHDTIVPVMVKSKPSHELFLTRFLREDPQKPAIWDDLRAYVCRRAIQFMENEHLEVALMREYSPLLAHNVDSPTITTFFATHLPTIGERTDLLLKGNLYHYVPSVGIFRITIRPSDSFDASFEFQTVKQINEDPARASLKDIIPPISGVYMERIFHVSYFIPDMLPLGEFMRDLSLGNNKQIPYKHPFNQADIYLAFSVVRQIAHHLKRLRDFNISHRPLHVDRILIYSHPDFINQSSSTEDDDDDDDDDNEEESDIEVQPMVDNNNKIPDELIKNIWGDLPRDLPVVEQPSIVVEEGDIVEASKPPSIPPIPPGVPRVSLIDFSTHYPEDIDALFSALLPPEYFCVSGDAMWSRSTPESAHIYSLSILLWSLLTRGANPYLGFRSIDDIKRYVLNGGRPQTSHLSSEITCVLEACWNQDIEFRLTLDELIDFLDSKQSTYVYGLTATRPFHKHY